VLEYALDLAVEKLLLGFWRIHGKQATTKIVASTALLDSKEALGAQGVVRSVDVILKEEKASMSFFSFLLLLLLLSKSEMLLMSTVMCCSSAAVVRMASILATESGSLT